MSNKTSLWQEYFALYLTIVLTITRHDLKESFLQNLKNVVQEFFVVKTELKCQFKEIVTDLIQLYL